MQVIQNFILCNFFLALSGKLALDSINSRLSSEGRQCMERTFIAEVIHERLRCFLLHYKLK